MNCPILFCLLLKLRSKTLFILIMLFRFAFKRSIVAIISIRYRYSVTHYYQKEFHNANICKRIYERNNSDEIYMRDLIIRIVFVKWYENRRYWKHPFYHLPTLLSFS